MRRDNVSRLFQVDSFTREPFAGNPAGVCLLDMVPSDEWMQLVAREMNLSETAFLMKEDQSYRLRWFTPSLEVLLCGHATLVTAHVLWEQELAPPDSKLVFRTLSGPLEAI